MREHNEIVFDETTNEVVSVETTSPAPKEEQEKIDERKEKRELLLPL